MSESWTEEWLGKAEQDFLAASMLDPEATPGAVCFHCQQCIEKYLKAALVRHGDKPRKTHDLLVLNGMAT
jgi:HEPN domain-containing protein